MLRSAGGGGVVFLLRDDFTTADAAPLTSPRTCEPGPGTLTSVQNDGDFGIVSGILEYSAQATPAVEDLKLADNGGYARLAGRFVVYRISKDNTTTPYPRVGWNFSPTTTSQATKYYGVGFDDAARLFALSAAIAPQVGSYIGATYYLMGAVLRATGSFSVIKGGAFTEWTVLWVNASGSEATLYPAMSVYNGAGDLDYIRASDLTAPWTTDNGIATQVLSGARSAGDTWTHEADHLTYTTITTLPTALQIEFRFRIQDTSNYWQITIDSAGKMDLDEVVAGVATERGTSTTVTAGESIGWIAAGTTISVFDSTARRINYTSASNFATATSGKLETEGTGGAVTGIEVWPRTLSGTALAALDAVVNA